LFVKPLMPFPTSALREACREEGRRAEGGSREPSAPFLPHRNILTIRLDFGRKMAMRAAESAPI